MRKKLVFNLADRAEYFDALKKLHGGSNDNNEEKENRDKTTNGSDTGKTDTKRVSGM